MPAHHHVLVVPVAEGGELVFAHGQDGGIRVWTRGLTTRLDETPRPKGLAAMYAGTIYGLGPLQEFVDAFLDRDDVTTLPMSSRGRRRDIRTLLDRCGANTLTSSHHFRRVGVSPLHTYGPWKAAAPELVLTTPRRGPDRTGFFLTGIPELPDGLEPVDALSLPTAAVIARDDVELVAEYLHARLRATDVHQAT